ncbi:AAA family ATPase [Nocardia otitidiscaviarum]|uniref:ATP-binding protein n=1 Tax=Nocardia otitidiscaviarum TaxID=1823 RepID=UPI0004A72C12|nr:helix-turn-helix transcriptional regulator [Nocardia otitidiscaviarum]MBF6132099.1 AAA family ATPase [Nocardia otitidiscaviarum]MBF6483229.1 AAA family ATPase [Nocardia otitidiscaviarum]
MPMFGRDAERKDLATLVDGPDQRSGILVVGAPGIGKSSLVEETVATAAAAGVRVLRTAGAEAEHGLVYAGLHRLLYPLRRAFDDLPARQFEALTAAVGISDAVGEPSPHLVGLAALTLLADVAAERPVLLVVEDVHWLDPASAEVLAFVARRIDSEPVAMVATVRDGTSSPLRDAELTVMRLGPLPDDDAIALLDSIAPELTAQARIRVLAESCGNPLALTELPTAVVDLAESTPTLPLTERLERAFSTRGAALPERTRSALLVAALNDSDSITETLAAAEILLGSMAAPDVLAPAVAANLIDIVSNTVTFRHPLVRSALVAAAPDEERRRAHSALADRLAGFPDRQVWHRAAGTAGADEEVAAALEDAAERSRHRGGAVTALERAAALSATPGRRADRLLRAAELAVDSGHRDTVERLVGTARTLPLTAAQEATANWILSGFEDGMRESPSRIGELADLATSVAADGYPDPALRILWGAAMRCFWSEPGPDIRRAVLAVADTFGIPDGDPRKLAIDSIVAPFERGEQVLRHLRALAATTGRDPEVDHFLSSAAYQVGAFDLAAHFAGAATPGFRSAGRLGLLTRALAIHAWSLARLGDLATAAPIAAEAAAFARETRAPFMHAVAIAVQAEIAALRGDYAQAAALAADAERTGLAAAARPVLATVQLTRGLIALGEGRFDDAFTDLARIHDPREPSYSPALRACFLTELAEAAVRSGRTDAATELLRELEPVAESTSSPALHIGIRYARAVLAGDSADVLFNAALETDLTGWPAERGRLHLAYGEWLRRQRRVVESRTHLRKARETFDALGFKAWSERARLELRSAGESSPNRDPDARERLTPHELSIAQLAAQGLTNREIGQRLYLSHRTVSTHLHRIFPKLGISARGDLAALLSTENEIPR